MSSQTNTFNNKIASALGSLPASGRRPNHAKRLAELSSQNAEAILELIKEGRHLAENGHTREANRMVKTIHRLLDNNQQLQNTVGEMLAESD